MLPEKLFSTLTAANVRYAVFGGSQVALVTHNRTPTDIDIIVHNDDFQKASSLFSDSTTEHTAHFPVQTKDGETLTCIADTITFCYEDYAIDIMANCRFQVADGKTFPVFLTDLAMAHRSESHGVWLMNSVDTLLIKSFMRRGSDQGKFDYEDGKALYVTDEIDGEYMNARLSEVGHYQPSLTFLKAVQGHTSAAAAVDVTHQDDRHQRHFLAAFFFSLVWGVLGVDRFYLGKVGTGIMKLLTLGGVGIWVIVDLALIMSGAMRDKQGNTLREYERYKKFAVKTVFIYAVVLGAVLLLSGATAIFIIYQFVLMTMQNGPLDFEYPTSFDIPPLAL